MTYMEKFPQTLFVAPEANADGKMPNFPTDFPKLEKVDFPISIAPVYHATGMGMAEKVEPTRGLPSVLLINDNTGKPLGVTTPEYHPVEFGEVHEAIKTTLEENVPSKYRMGISIKEFFENNGAYCEAHYDMPYFRFPVTTPNGWKTHFSPTIIAKVPTNYAVTVIIGLRCSDTGNIYMAGNSMAATRQHRSGFTTDGFVKHLQFMLPQFPKVVTKMQEFADHKINIAQAENLLAMSNEFTETVQGNLLEWIKEEEIPTMGLNKLTLLAAIAAFSCDPENFRVKNEARADNTSETLASRKKWMSSFVSTPMFFGKGGFHA
jgi:hypothetical protein